MIRLIKTKNPVKITGFFVFEGAEDSNFLLIWQENAG
jgi:hypothetical protein